MNARSWLLPLCPITAVGGRRFGFRRGAKSLVGCIVLAWLVVAGASLAHGQMTQEFHLGGVDLGAIPHIGDFDWNETLEYRWDTSFSLGGIVGRPNATVIPGLVIPIPFAPNIVIPAVTADTRTGARFSGNIAGGIGLDFFADFSASGLAPGNLFDFKPTVTAPGAIPVGDFFRLSTTAGLQSDSAFTADRVQLPSFEAGMDLLFDLAIHGKVEGALFPILPYGSANIAMDEPWSVNQSLVNFGFDLNPGTAQPPTLTFLKDTGIEQTYTVLDPDVSGMSVLLSYGPPTNRIDLGEIEIINPFGADQSIIGGVKPNLSIDTSMNESSVGFSFETPLLRMGLDLDGIAGYLVTGALGYPTSAVTRFDEEIDDFAKVYLELIDIKYGPEIGYRERVDIRPDFEVTLDFDRQVAVRTASGYEQVEQFTGLWSDLPEIALLTDDPVAVNVSFDALLGHQDKQMSLFLTDYLQVKALEGGVELFDALNLSFPPLLQYRTSLLGLLGEVELDVFRATHEIAPIALENMTSSFWLYPREGDFRLLYWASSANNDPSRLDRWARLAVHSTPTSLAGSVLLVGLGDSSAGHVGQLLPMTLMDSGAASSILDDQPISVDELRILPGSKVIQSGLRQWWLGKVHNDGLYLSDGTTEFRDWSGGKLHITGQGEMRFSGLVSFSAFHELVHGQGHTLVFQGAQGLGGADQPLRVTQLDNRGTIIFENMVMQQQPNIHNRGTIIFDDTTTYLQQLFQYPTGSVVARGGAAVSLGWLYMLRGRLAATGPGSQLILHDTVAIYPVTPWAEGARDIVFVASDGGEILGAPPIEGWYSSYRHIQDVLNPENSHPSSGAAGPLMSQITFRAEEDGKVNFTGPIKQTLGLSTRFEIAAGGEMALRGTRLRYMWDGNEDAYDDDNGADDVDPPDYSELVLDPSWMPDFADVAHRLRAMAGQMFIVENHGTLNVFDSNRLYLKLPLPEDLAPALYPHERSPLLNMQPNLVNSGHIIVHEGASLDFQIGVADNAPRGIVFDEGTWTLLDGGQVEVEPFGVTWAQGPPGAESPYYYLAVNASNVTLGGNARFDFLNTMEENRGSLTLQDGHSFVTAGNLLNRGEIRVESEATLQMPDARLTVDGGSVFIDGAAGASLVGAAHIDVLGGSFTHALAAGAVDIAEQWIVGERWLGLDAHGNDIVRPAGVSFGEAHIERILESGGVALAGSEASMAALATLAHNAGALSLATNHILTLGQDLVNAPTGRIELTTGGQLHIDGALSSYGELRVGAEGYLQAAALNLLAGHAMVDGVIEVPLVTIDEGVSVTGSTVLTGRLENRGQLAVGSSPGIMEVYGGITQTDSGRITFELFGQVAAESYDRLILHAHSEFDGILELVFGGDFDPSPWRTWLLVELRQAEGQEAPRHIDWRFADIAWTGLEAFGGGFDPAAFQRHPDDLLLGGWGDLAILLSVGTADAGGGLAVYAIPEPATLALLAIGGLACVLKRKRA